MNRKRNCNNAKTATQNYITVAIAEDAELAEEYVELLTERNIPCATERYSSLSTDSEVAVMTPAEFARQAQSIIEEQKNFDSFIDDVFNPEQNQDGNEELF